MYDWTFKVKGMKYPVGVLAKTEAEARAELARTLSGDWSQWKDQAATCQLVRSRPYP